MAIKNAREMWLKWFTWVGLILILVLLGVALLTWILIEELAALHLSSYWEEGIRTLWSQICSPPYWVMCVGLIMVDYLLMLLWVNTLKRSQEDEDAVNLRSVPIAMAVLSGLTLIVVVGLMGWRYLPGIWGEWIGMIVGIMSTPFFLEASFIFIGLSIVLIINHHLQKRAGDEFVDMEVSDSVRMSTTPKAEPKPSSRD